jgi:hypothetical protein
MESLNCVSTTRVTCEYFARTWMSARPVSCNFVLKVPVQKYMYLAGWTGREKGLLKAGEEDWIEHASGAPHWMGHTAALIQDRYLVDASVDQATNPKRGVVVPPLVLVFDLGPKGSAALWEGVSATITLRNGIIAVNYLGIHERNFLNSKPWRDDAGAKEVAVLIEHAIAGSLRP